MAPHVATSAEDIGSAAEYLPRERNLGALSSAAAACKACDLWMKGTRTIFGEGPEQAEVMFVGEQPGDIEDQEGHVFAGPSGRLLNAALKQAGIDRSKAYVTNAVKHFNWEETRGKRRIHKTPNAGEVSACRPWLSAEIALVQPRVIVALGATAAQSLLGQDFRVTQQRGEPVDSEWGAPVVATVHPSSVLRARTDEERRAARQAFVNDLKRVAELVSSARVV